MVLSVCDHLREGGVQSRRWFNRSTWSLSSNDGRSDAADAEPITDAAPPRPTMHFVAVNTEVQQAQGDGGGHQRPLLDREIVGLGHSK